jgi:hypothetical protein
MKRIYLFIFWTFSFCFANAQKNNKNPFDSLQQWDNQKPVLIYVFASWCGETIESYETIADTLEKYRDKFNLVMLIDTLSSHFKSIGKKEMLYQSDKIIDLADYYPHRLQKTSELKQLTLNFNSKFGSDLYRIGPASMLLIDKQNRFEKAFSPFNTAQELGNYFKSKGFQ